MSFLSDGEILHEIEKNDMIQNAVKEQVRRNEHGTEIISYGVSSYGYDVRLAETVVIFDNSKGGTIDPKKPDPALLKPAEVIRSMALGVRYFILPPNGYALGHTREYFNMPRDMTAVVLGKSTYARSGIIVNATPIEAGWSGEVVLEISNPTPLPARVYIDEGIAQFLFARGGRECLTSYADRSGKYQGQRGVTLSRV